MKLKIWLFLILFLIILGLAGYGYFKATPKAENQENIPRVEIGPKSFDFGEINFGDVVSYDFKVKNSGDKILEIKRIATSCPCASAKIEKEIIEPGEEVNLFVSYDSGAMGAHGKGEQERIIYVRSNDPINPQVEVVIYATVK